ncbi:MAG: multicopper oxidase domain-containing protein [Saprospiraceae bacterium]
MSTQIGLILSDPYVTPDIVPTPGPVVPGVIETTLIASYLPIVSGTTTINAETYNGAIPGPTFRLTVGDTVIVRLINNLPHETGIHWHGIELSNSADGTEVTQNGALGGPIPNGAVSGGTYLYKFKVTRPGIYWYHPHHHNSTNRVFKGMYGMIVVTDPDENSLADGIVLPLPADTKQIVLSDITVCKTPGTNDPATYPTPAGTEWLGSTPTVQVGPNPTSPQPGPTPFSLCELPTAVDDHGGIPATSYAAGDVPSLMIAAGRVNEGQTVLTNGVNVGPRAGSPTAPGTVVIDGITTHGLPVLSGQGLRLQIVNCATTRYFRLMLTDGAGVQVPLVRVGGEGGLLDNAVLEGLTTVPPLTFDPKYDSGEILLPPSTRADVVVAIPAGLAVGTVLTLWTRDFERLGSGGGPGGPWARLPSVPVMHLEVTGIVAAAAYSILGGPNGAGGTPLRARIGFPGPLVSSLGAATPPMLLTPSGFVPSKPGMDNPDIVLSSGTPSINGITGHELHGESPDPGYPNTLHIGSSRYAAAVAGRILELTVTNATNAHHPFHLHGFSMQPITLTRPANPTFTWGYSEFRDSIDVPADHTLTFRIRLDDRELVDGVTPGGFFGRWLLHCHIFWHHHRGMIGEFVVTDANGKERPTVDAGGSWAYAGSGLTTLRKGTFFSKDGSYPVNLVASLYSQAGVLIPLTAAQAMVTIDTLPTLTDPGTWSWTHPVIPDGIYYAYITGTDSLSLIGQDVFRLKIGAPDDGSDNGDPHIHTVDGKNYDFQAAGEFILLRDGEGLEVQSRQTPVLTANPITDAYTGIKSCVSLNTAVAARVGTHRIALQPGKEPGEFLFYVDGKETRLTNEGINLDGHHVSGFDVNGVTALRVDYLHQAVLIATPLLWTTHNVWYLNISIARTQADEGLMGAIPQNTWLPLLPSGASVGPMPNSVNERYVTLYKTFADAWRLTDQSSLFVYRQGTSTSTFTDKNWPAGEPPCELQPQFEIPGWVIPQGMEIDKAKQICEIITDDGLKQDCVFDVATTGDADFAKAYLITQEIRQRSTAVQIAPTEMGVITAIVSPLIGKQPTPRGTVTFYVDNNAAGAAIQLDSDGRAKWVIEGLDKGTYNIRATYTPDDKTVNHPSSSPNLSYTVTENTNKPGGGTSQGCLAQPWYVWVALILIVLVLVWILF